MNLENVSSCQHPTPPVCVFLRFRSKMVVSGEKVRLVGQFEILAQDNFFPSKVRLVGQFILRSCPTGRTPVYIFSRFFLGMCHFH